MKKNYQRQRGHEDFTDDIVGINKNILLPGTINNVWLLTFGSWICRPVSMGYSTVYQRMRAFCVSVVKNIISYVKSHRVCSCVVRDTLPDYNLYNCFFDNESVIYIIDEVFRRTDIKDWLSTVAVCVLLALVRSIVGLVVFFLYNRSNIVTLFIKICLFSGWRGMNLCKFRTGMHVM